MGITQSIRRALHPSRGAGWVGAAALVASAAPAVSHAQAAPANRSATTLEDVIVTATKREERLREVPLSVSAISGEDLERRQITSLADVAGQVPGFALQQASVTLNRLIIRGQNSGGSGATVATVVDDVPYSFSSAESDGAVTTADLYTYDMARIEVLRGPQGTLYGAGAEGGLFKYVTNAPDLSAFKAEVQVGGETVADGKTAGNIRGIINVPLSDKAAFRLMAFDDTSPAWNDNWLLGKKDANTARRKGGRASLLLKPIDDLTIRATVFYEQRKTDGLSAVTVAGQPDGQNVVPANRFDLVRGLGYGSFFPAVETAPQSNANLNVAWNMNWATLTSVSAYSKIKSRWSNDLSGTLFAPRFDAVMALSPVYGQTIAARSENDIALTKYSQELRLASNPSSGDGFSIDWQGGVFATKEDTAFFQTFQVLSAATLQELTVPLPAGTDEAPSSYKEVSGFGEVTLKFSPRFDIGIGGRYTHVKQEARTTFFFGLITTGGAPDQVNDPFSASQSATTWSFAPRFKISDDTVTYLRIAKGFRPGGPQLSIPLPPPDFPFAFKADSTINYEVGLRTLLWDKRLSIDVAAFYIDWKDIQIVGTFLSGNGQTYSVTTNAGKAKSQGLEWTFALRPVGGLQFGLTGSYTDAKLSADGPAALRAKDGDRLAYVPKLQGALSADYDWAIGPDVQLSAGASFSYFGSFYTDFGSPFAVTASHVELPSYHQLGVNLSATWRERYSAELYARNLTDERALLGYSSGGAPGAFVGSAPILEPRTIGLRLGVKF